jgi:dTDP-4-amino-4,6-dideoxygalactose transaminase
LQEIPLYSTNNAHIFYLLCPSKDGRNQLIEIFVKHEIYAIFHYLSLHASPYYSKEHDGRQLKNSDSFSDILIRLPMFNTLKLSEIERVVDIIKKEFN